MKKECSKFTFHILFLLFAAFFLNSRATAQDIRLERVDPPSWWTGFKNHTLQLMVYGHNISQTTPVIKSPGIHYIDKVYSSNPDYLFINLELEDELKPGTIIISFRKGDREIDHYNYVFRAREPGSATRQGFSSADVIYLLMPDRFCNGDPLNDSVPGYFQGVHRGDPDSRHGGDIKGIINHLDYIQKAGFTTLWCTPLLENNMKNYSYHGYSITDHYKVDPRFGNNTDYKALADSLHHKGMKLIMDMVFNHCGSNHWWIKNLPDTNWIHTFPEFTRTSYRVGSQSDPHLSRADHNQYENGWFDVTMPDLNQKNPFLAKYLVQNTIWWMEYSGADGIRVDTYPYCDKNFMNRWDEAVLAEYPSINIVGECWANTPESIAYWQKGSVNRDGYQPKLPSVIDFAMYDALRLGFMEEPNWNTGIFRLYDILSKDFVYPETNNILIFADNLDVGRYLASQNQDIAKLKMAMAFLLTSRGIPQVFYGTEALLTTAGDAGHGKLRMDFPGGWENDSVNAFTGKNLSDNQREMEDFMSRILNWRKTKPVIASGRLTHFVPDDGLYVFFRDNENETVMVAINNNKKEKVIDRKRYDEFLSKFRKAKDIISGYTFDDPGKIAVPPGSAMILELSK
ncbi:MAG: glycoside hydrolase family 13 protein [Syntrophothermus sp.]